MLFQSESSHSPRHSLFRPIYEKVRTALRDQEFLPTADGNYVAGKRAVLARAEDLVNLMTSEQLSFSIRQIVKIRMAYNRYHGNKKGSPSVFSRLEAKLLRYWRGNRATYCF